MSDTFTAEDARAAFNIGSLGASAGDMGADANAAGTEFARSQYPNNQRRAKRAYLAGVDSVAIPASESESEN